MGFIEKRKKEIEKKLNSGTLFRDIYQILVFIVLILIFIDKIESYFANHLYRPDPVRTEPLNVDIQWDVEEPYVVAYDNYLFNSDGKSVNLLDDLILKPHPEAKEDLVKYKKYFEICTDAKRQHVLVLTCLDDLYIFDTDLNGKFISKKVDDFGMDMGGYRAFYIRYSQDKKYAGERRLYLYDIDGQYDFGRVFWNEELMFGGISPNGRYFAAYQYQYGDDSTIKVLDIDNNCKEVYSFDAQGYNDNPAYPMYVSDDGNLVYCRRSTPEDKYSFSIAIYKEGEEVALSYNTEYGFAVFSRDLTKMIFSQGDNLYFFSELYIKPSLIDDDITGNMSIDRKYFKPNTQYDRIFVETEEEFGGFIIRGKRNARYYGDNMKLHNLPFDFSNYLYSYSEDGITAVYYINEKGALEKMTYREDEKWTSGFEKELYPLEITSNDSHNKLWVLTNDYEIYCIDGSNDTVSFVTAIDKDYNYSGCVLRYSKMDKRLYYRSGAALYSMDTENGSEKLITDECYSLDAPEDEEYLLHYHEINNANECIQIGDMSVKIG